MGASEELRKAAEELGITPRKPMLCPGCPHRASFFSIMQALPRAKTIYPSDIGCYTLAVNQGMVDSVVDMGASITQSSGLFMAYRADGKEQPIVATLGIPPSSTWVSPGLSAPSTTGTPSSWPYWTTASRP